MKKETQNKSNHKTWRKLVKKLQRKKKRQKAAIERDKVLDEEETALRNDPVYQQWQQQQNALEEFERLAEERKRQAEEEAWLRRELISQQQFRLEQQRRTAAEAAKEAIRLQQEKEYEERLAAERKRKEEKERRAAEAAAEFERIMQRMEEYLAKPHMSTPSELTRIMESRPGQKICEIFERTNCCRFGMRCQFNHRRPMLACILVMRHFFTHPLLEQVTHDEYNGGECLLEISEHDLRDDYDSFFNDVVPELESFGKILNFRTLSNIQQHLRGNVFVEYTEERAALKAFIKLQGRYYAGKRMNVEFSNITAWRGSICGLSVARKCPKGQFCNYLHVFRNPENKYNTLLECRLGYSNKKITNTPLISWNDVSSVGSDKNSRNWRWSESPELELKSDTKNVVNNGKTRDDNPKCDNKRKQLKEKALKERAKRRSTSSNDHDNISKRSRSPKRSSSPKHSKSPKRVRSHKRSKSRSRSKSRERRRLPYKSSKRRSRSKS